MVDFERARLAALLTYKIVDTAPEPVFDRMTALAASMLQAPVALLSFLDERRLWVKSAFGADLKEAPRTQTFCNQTIQQSEPLVVLDTQLDMRFAGLRFPALPFGPASPGVRFYAGAALATPAGARIGSISVMDWTPRLRVTAPQLAALEGLADLAMAQLEERRQSLDATAGFQRALLTGRLHAQIALAPGRQSALDAAMQMLGGNFGAVAGQLWRGATDGRLNQLGSYGDHGALATAGPGPGEPISLLTSTAIRLDEPLAVTISLQGPALAQPATALRRLLIVPLSAGADDYAIVLGFDTDHAELSALVTEMSTLRAALKPVLDHKANEEQMRLLSSALRRVAGGVMIIGLDPADPADHRIAYVNDSLCQMTGYSGADLIGRPPSMLNGAETDLATVQQLLADWHAGRASSATLVQYRKDGSKFYAEIDAAPMQGDDGRTTHGVSLLRDVTSRLQDETRLRERHALLRFLFEANPLPMWVIDRQTLRFLSVNHAAVHFYGWSHEQFLTMTLHDLTPPGEALPERVLETAEPQIWTHRRASGQVVQVGGMIKPHQVGGADEILGVVWDMTEVQAARAELRRTNELLRDLAQQLRARSEELTEAHRLAQLGTWRLSADLREMTWSDEIYSLIGRDRSSFPPSVENALQILHPDDRKLFEGPAAPIQIDGGGGGQVEARIVRPDGRARHMRVDSRPAGPGPGGQTGGLFGYVQDISDRKEAEQAIRRSEKLSILGHLTGGIAHDFNNLLTVVTINLEEAITSLPDPDPLQDILVPALQAAQRGAELTNQLLAYARQAPLRPQEVSLHSFFATCRPMIRQALGRKYELTIAVADESGATRVDPSQLQTALLNIVLNARDAMPAGGPIHIGACTTTLPSAEFGLGDVAPGDFAMISVTDHGVGIAPEVMPHIFEPFYTTKDVGSGSGLGLSMVDGFIRQSGGYTVVQSQVGEGTTVTLFLPLVPQPPDPVDEPRPGRRKRALLVDDQPAVLAAASRMFAQLGYEVRAVPTAAAALDELERDGDFVILFTDIVLPGGMDGIALAKLVARRWPDTRILLTSGFSEYNLSQAEVPGVEIVMKPYKRQELIDRLNRIMQPRALDEDGV